MNRLLTLLLAGAILCSSLPIRAAHNSAGAHLGLMDPQATNNEGDLISHVDEERAAWFHEDAADQGLIPAPRPSPQDQRGERYTECATHAQKGSRYDPANNQDHCYIGYFEVFRMWRAAWTPLFTHQSTDPLYAANPHPEDSWCGGGEDPINQLQRASDDECGGEGHSHYTIGSVLIDTNLMETGSRTVTESLGDEHQDRTLPLVTQPYAIVFGQPHPDANGHARDLDYVDDGRFVAGQGPFGPNPIELGNPLHDLTGACGERTKDCHLLTPQDLRLYDEAKQGRVCEYAPQFEPVHTAKQDPGPCGFNGNALDLFIDDVAKGGFSMFGLSQESGSPSWMSNLPGWYRGVSTVSTPSARMAASLAASYLNDTGDYSDTLHFYYAVNPEVPSMNHPLWCAQPSILSGGGGLEDLSPEDDPGFYGSYRADAVEYNQHPVSGAPVIKEAHRLSHGELRSIVGPLQTQIESYEDDVRRAAYSPAVSKDHNQLGNTQNEFSVSLDSSLSCTLEGEPVYTEDGSYDGGLIFNTIVDTSPNLINPETDLLHSFEGTIKGVVDTSEDAALGECPEEDDCVWQPYWDSYRDTCTTYQQESCRSYLERVGYDTDTGVGLLFTIEAEGPLAVLDAAVLDRSMDQNRNEDRDGLAERTTVVTGAPGASSCVIGVSYEFQEKVKDMLEGERWNDIVHRPDVCPSLEAEDGGWVVVADAFEPQDASDAGKFSSDIRFIPIDASEVDVCVAGFWSVQGAITDDTLDSLKHGSNVQYGECVSGTSASVWEIG